MARRYGEEFKRQAVELVIHSGKTQRQVARELDVSEYSLNLWKKAYLGQQRISDGDIEPKTNRRCTISENWLKKLVALVVRGITREGSCPL